MSIVGIWSDKNNLKHYIQDTASMNRPNTADGFGNFFSTSTIVHNLGYRPLIRVYYDPLGTGTYYPLIGQYVSASGVGSNSPLVSVAPFILFADTVTETSIGLVAWDTGSNAGTFDYYYRVYIDPTL